MSAGVVAGSHPGWCSPVQCGPVGGGVLHVSEPVSLRTRRALLTLSWVRRDESGQPGGTELRVDVVHGEFAGCDTELFLLPQEVHRFIERLTTEYHRQRYLAAPVLHDTQAVA